MRPLLATPPKLSPVAGCRILQPCHDRGASMGELDILSRGRSAVGTNTVLLEVSAVGCDVLADPFPKRRISRRPAQLPAGVLDRDDTAEGGFDLVLGGHGVAHLDAAARNKLGDE